MTAIESINKTGKVTKLTQGSYIYNGINFDIEIFEQGYWAIDSSSFIQKNEMTEEQVEDATYYLRYDTKRDLVSNLKHIDYWIGK